MICKDDILTSIIIIIVLVGLAFIGSYIYKPQAIQAETVRPYLRRIPAKYINNMQALFRDYQQNLITLDEVMQIHILWHIENDGEFMTLFDTDTYADKYFVHKKTHNDLKAQKSQRHRPRPKGKR